MPIPFEIKKISSNIINYGKIFKEDIIDTINSNINENEMYYIIAHKNHEVLVGKVDKKNIKFYSNQTIEPEHILEIRIFNEDKELHIIKEDDYFIWRLRVDNEELKKGIDEEIVEVYDEKHFILGTRAEKYNDNWSILLEERGSKIFVPFSIELFNNKSKNSKMYYIARNYISNDKLIRFEDARLIKLEIEKGED